MPDTFDEEYDIVVIGSGAAGLTGAIAAAKQGLRTIVIEKAAVWGGTSAWSGGGVWAPANPLQKAAGIEDSLEEADKFLQLSVPEEGLVTTEERRTAFLRTAPEMVGFLIGEGMQWTCFDSPDYRSDLAHARRGRCLDSRIFDAKKLGPMRATMRRGPAPYAIRLQDISRIAQGVTSLSSVSMMAQVFLRQKLAAACGKDPVGCGESLMAQLMVIAHGRGIEVRLDTPLQDLLRDSGRVTGVVVGRGKTSRRIGARAGVLLAAGGFAHGSYRKEIAGSFGEMSSASPDDTGDIVKMAHGLGAMTAMLDSAWWGTAFLYPGDVAVFCQWERSLPFSLVVDDKGQRFANEAQDYYRFGEAMIAHGVDRAWLIMDARHRKRYTFGGFFPGRTPQAMFEAGFFRKADTLNGIAQACGLNPQTVAETVARFNRLVDAGVDSDFQRGGQPYDRSWGDPTIKPNPNLGKLEQGPFLATRLYLGDLGTKGGYVTDSHARVLDLEARPIEGLYAAGNCTASVMGRAYPGPGVTLGPAMTFAYAAARHAAKRATNQPSAASMLSVVQ